MRVSVVRPTLPVVTHEVRITDSEPTPTLVAPAATSWPEFPTLWKVLLDEVWACLHAAGIQRGCRNIMLYLDDTPHVEVGVELSRTIPVTGRVVTSVLPAGRAAMTVHRGPYSGLGDAHRAVLDWCQAHGHQPTGVRWERYGPHDDDPAEVWTEVYYQLA